MFKVNNFLPVIAVLTIAALPVHACSAAPKYPVVSNCKMQTITDFSFFSNGIKKSIKVCRVKTGGQPLSRAMAAVASRRIYPEFKPNMRINKKKNVADVTGKHLGERVRFRLIKVED